jgi:hypothetical protein
MMGAFLLRVLWLVFLTPVAGAQSWVSRSHDVFFPPEVARYAEPYQRFSAFWWNYWVVDAPPEEVPEVIAEVCAKIEAQHSSEVTRSACPGALARLRPLFEEWVEHRPRRVAFSQAQSPTTAIAASMARASLPGTSDLIWLFRIDPFASYLQLKEHWETLLKQSEMSQGGVVIDPKLGRMALPLSFSFSPTESSKTETIWQSLSQLKKKGHLVGPHASAFENESQVHRDLDVVSWVGVLFLVGFFAVLALLRRLRLILVYLPILLSTVLATITTILYYGQIHGLTLALGSGIIGLAVDYGMHAAFYRQAWRANWYGLLTTLVVLAMVGTSSIPLLRQMMFFAGTGLVFGYLILGLVFAYASRFFTVRPFSFRPRLTILGGGFAVLLIVGGIVAACFLPLNLDLRTFDYQSSRTKELHQWLGARVKTRPPMLEIINDGNGKALDEFWRRREFADGQKIRHEMISDYLPRQEMQVANLNSWKAEVCPKSSWALTPSAAEFAAPWIESIQCSRLGTIEPPRRGNIPQYLQHLYDQERWLGLWLPTDLQQENLIRAQYPDAITLAEVPRMFSNHLARDLTRIIPFAVLGVFVLLYLQFRNWRLATIASLPGWTGAGALFLAFWLFSLPLSFMSQIALLMIVGVSVDYGIFVTENFYRHQGELQEGVWSSLLLSSFTTIAGFGPLAFAAHPVLKHLGLGLLSGTLGTLLGVLWALPLLLEKFAKVKKVRHA